MVEGLVTDSVTGSPLFDAEVEIVGQGISENTNLSGVYKQEWDECTFQVRLKRQIMHPNNPSQSVSGQVTNVNVELVTAVPFQLTGRG